MSPASLQSALQLMPPHQHWKKNRQKKGRERRGVIKVNRIINGRTFQVNGHYKNTT